MRVHACLSAQLQSLKHFQAWRTIFDSQLPLCLYLYIAISTGSVFAIMASCPLYYLPRLVSENEHLRTCFVLLIALLVPVAAVSNFNLPVPVRPRTHTHARMHAHTRVHACTRTRTHARVSHSLRLTPCPLSGFHVGTHFNCLSVRVWPPTPSPITFI